MSFFKARQNTVKPNSNTTEADNALLQMVDRTQAVIHFKPDGTILTANENFLAVLGYTLDEVQDQKHDMFVDEAYRASKEYATFWDDLRAGKTFSNRFARQCKDGSTIWIQATYAPIFDADGTVSRVTKVATDVTDQQTTIQEIEDALAKLRNGDLVHRVRVSDVPELQALCHTFNDAVSQLSQLVMRVKSVSGTVQTTAGEISTSSEDLSRRTETQAATLEQTAAAVEELSHSAEAAARNAAETNTITNETRSAAEDSRQVVDDVVEAMQRIETSSGKINQILTVIDDIAFQTNLLALNAGVEAARAGEAGRGFAVVASEVRGLAQRSAESAQEIKGLITESSDHVTTGSELVGRAGEELTRIFEGVGDISEKIGGIAHGLTEQSSTLRELNAAVSQLDEVTQQNAAMVQVTLETSRTLYNDAEAMSSDVSQFLVAPSEHTSQWDAGGGLELQAQTAVA